MPEIERAIAATDVDAAGVAAMAVAPDGTIWLVHSTGRVYMARAGGEVTPAPGAGTPPIAELAAATIGPDGDLYLVTDQSRAVSRRGAAGATTWSRVELHGLPSRAALTGVEVTSDETVYVADGNTGTVFRARPDRRLRAVRGTPDNGCRSTGTLPPYPIDLTHTLAAGLVVADPACDLYRPGRGAIADTPDCLESPDSAAFPVAVSELTERELVVGGRYCRLVWRVPATGGGAVEIADDDELDAFPRAIDVDREGVVYVLDEDGVVAMRP